MDQQDPNPIRRHRLRASLALAAASGVAAAALSLPASPAYADPVAPVTPSPAPAEPAPAPAPAPADPNAPAPAPAPADPNAPAPAPAPAPADPNAPAPAPGPVDPNAPAPAPGPAPEEPGRVNNAAGNFSFVVPAGWVLGDATKLNYGQALLSKETAPAVPGQPAPVASDTSILLGRLDLKLFAGAEPDNAKAAVRLASDMGEFFMPFPGTRINQQTFPLNANGLTGSASYYEVKFTDTTKPNGQIWAGVVGDAGVNAPRGQRNERWFVVWLGTSKTPIDTNAAVALANSIRPWTPPPPPEAPAPDPNAPAPEPGRPQIGVPVPVAPEDAPGMMPQ